MMIETATSDIAPQRIARTRHSYKFDTENRKFISMRILLLAFDLPRENSVRKCRKELGDYSCSNAKMTLDAYAWDSCK